MGILANRNQVRREAQQELSDLLARKKTVLVIHYSCESFYDRDDHSTPRITSIAVRHLVSGITHSFSIQQVSERATGNGQIDDANYATLESQMLQDFYDFVEQHGRHIWLHWNMRDINYGFPAIAHRFEVLGGTPVPIHESERVDLARILVSIYGRRYVPHPRLKSIIERNHMTMRDFLTGQQEAHAFDNRQYLPIHQSTLRKVDCICGIVERAGAGTLKTDARLKQIYGSVFAWFTHFMTEHWIVATVGFAASLIAVVVVILKLFA